MTVSTAYFFNEIADLKGMLTAHRRFFITRNTDIKKTLISALLVAVMAAPVLAKPQETHVYCFCPNAHAIRQMNFDQI